MIMLFYILIIIIIFIIFIRIIIRKKVIVNKLHHNISIGLSHSNKNDSGTFSPSIKELLNKIQLKR